LFDDVAGVVVTYGVDIVGITVIWCDNDSVAVYRVVVVVIVVVVVGVCVRVICCDGVVVV